MPELALIILLVIAAWLIWLVRRRKPQPPIGANDGRIPDELSLHPRPLLSPADAAFYNVLQLAVQEHYLVFARVPISRLVSVEPKDPKDLRTAAVLSRRLARTCVDFALVHPGTLDVSQVVELEDSSDGQNGVQTRNGVTQQVLQEAGIRFVRLSRNQAYTAPGLANLLGLDARD